jgi:hypothetical protein
VRIMEGKERKRTDRPKGKKSKPWYGDVSKYLSRSDNGEKDYLDRIALENSLLLSGAGGGQLYHEQYDEHGVKIEHQWFS